jgi:tetratricopeptide (TPR) repeat protein
VIVLSAATGHKPLFRLTEVAKRIWGEDAASFVRVSRTFGNEGLRGRIALRMTITALRRFDLADQAYAAAIKLTGETVQILNDRGYSYLLRGDLGKARAKFLKAYQLDPTNPTVINNLQLLNASYRFIERAP